MPRLAAVRLVRVRAVLRLAAALLGILLVAAPAWGTIVPVLGDAHVSSSYPGANFGTGSNLDVGGGNTALLQFDVNSWLPTGITSSQVASAKLTVFVNRVNSGGLVN